MKRLFLWTFERGSLQYDVMCGLILVFLFLVPRATFKDEPEFMRVSEGERIHRTVDRNGNSILTVKLEKPVFFDSEGARKAATKSAEQYLGRPVGDSPRMEPIHDWTGHLVGYAVWVER
jgi:hypothetical protein